MASAGWAQSELRGSWQYPDDAKAIRWQQAPKPYAANGLPEGTVQRVTRYRGHGLRMRNPNGAGYWEFEEVSKLYYRGRLFAIVGNATGINDAGDGSLGYAATLVIYDEDGDGKLESPEFVGGKDLFVFHVPSWVRVTR